MSGPSGEDRPRPRPKRPKPPATDGFTTEPETNPGEGASTFRPNPRRATASKARGGDSDDAKVTRGSGEAPRFLERVLFGSVSSGQLATFCRQAAAYLSAGVDINKSLTNLQLQFSSTALGPVIGRMRAAIKRGDSFGDAVSREPKAFDPLFLSMIKVAEARGGVPETLRQLAHHYEARQRLIRQARTAMIYPIAVLSIASVVIAILTIFVLPVFAEMLKDIAGRGAQLPLPSRVLMGLSDFVRSVGWLAIPIVMVGTPILLLQAYKTAGGKRLMDRLALSTPVFGALLSKLDTSRFARALSSLLDAGVDVGASLDLAADIVRLEPFRQALGNVREEVMHGSELSDALERTRRFGPDVIAVVGTGEETGKLPESLNHLADDYEDQVEHTVRNLGQLIQPLLVIGLGGAVLFIILAVILPYISLISSLTR